jgi:hypothetical protein
VKVSAYFFSVLSVIVQFKVKLYFKVKLNTMKFLRLAFSGNLPINSDKVDKESNFEKTVDD